MAGRLLVATVFHYYRHDHCIPSGNLTDPSAGAVVATFLSEIGAELGIFGANGVFYPDVRFVAQFVDDSALAYFNLRGVNTAYEGYEYHF